MDLAALVKAISDRANLLFGAAFAGFAFFYGSRAGYITDVNPTFLHSVYWIALLSSSALAFGVASSLFVYIMRALGRRQARRERARLALQNFASMMPLHRATLVFLKDKNAQRFPQPEVSSTLEDMAALGLMERDCNIPYHSDTVYYRVADIIWRNMERLGWPKGESVPSQAPWQVADNRRI